MQFSKFGEKFNRYSGITRLMDDLNDGLRTPGAITCAVVIYIYKCMHMRMRMPMPSHVMNDEVTL